MLSTKLLTSVAGTVLLFGAASFASAQTIITGETTDSLNTSTEGDIVIAAGSLALAETDTTEAVDAVEEGVITITNSGNIVTLDSDNSITHNGIIQAEDVDDVVGVLITGGNTGEYTGSGSISLTETFAPEDTDESGTLDGPFAQGENRIGILISGASPFTGNVETTGGNIIIEGNNSAAIRLDANTSITGNIISGGGLSVEGTNATGLDIEGAVIGALASNGVISTQGEGARAIHVQGDITEGFSNTNSIANTGLRFITRLNAIQRDLIDDEDTLQAGAAIEINGNVGQGVLLNSATETTIDDDGEETVTVLTTSSITQIGAAPAVLIDGQGTPITLGIVADITDPTDPDFNASTQFGFVQQGLISASGILNDSPATGVEFADVTVENGIFNSGGITSSTFRGGDDGTDDVGNFDGHARGIHLSANVNAQDIVNQGSISATSSEATDEVFADRDNVTPARLVQATALDISDDSVVDSLTNTGLILATTIARDGLATAIIDRSGTLNSVTNQGFIRAQEANSDTAGFETSDNTTVALDLSANTSGVTILQSPILDSDTGDALNRPEIEGDIFLGSGDDSFTSISGNIIGALAFGDGADVFSLDDSEYSGALSDSDGLLDLTVANNSILSQESDQALNLTDATIDATSTFQTTLNGVTGEAGSLIATNNITFEEGASIGLTLNNVLDVDTQTFTIASADNTLDIQGAIDELDTSVSPFLYDITYGLDPADANTLVVTLDLRDTEQLGLDTRQAASFTSAFEALASNAELGQAFTAITEEAEFNQAFNQLLPEISASPLYFIQANVDGAIGAVGSHLENARRSQDRTGGAWLQQFTYFADREQDNLSEQFRGFGFGFAGGFDTAWGPFHAVGANVAFSSTQVEDVLGVDDPLDIVTYQVGGYAAAERNNFSLDLYAGVGTSDIESNRTVAIGDFVGGSNAEWNATHINGSARLGYTTEIGERFWARPTLTLDYLRLEEDAFRETGPSGLALGVEARTSERAGATALLNLGATFNGRRTWIRPALRAGYRTDFVSDPVLTQFQFINLSDGAGGLIDGTLAETVSGDVADDGFILGFSVGAGSKWSSFSFDFDSDIRDGFIRHTGRVVVRLLF